MPKGGLISFIVDRFKWFKLPERFKLSVAEEKE
jgi:hypothetical protein